MGEAKIGDSSEYTRVSTEYVHDEYPYPPGANKSDDYEGMKLTYR